MTLYYKYSWYNNITYTIILIKNHIFLVSQNEQDAVLKFEKFKNITDLLLNVLQGTPQLEYIIPIGKMKRSRKKKTTRIV